MKYQVLARKWRPKTFDEVKGQPHIVRTIKNSIRDKRIAQAFLLTGTRGVGKTTIARLFAKTLRCENLKESIDPCGECSSCKSIDDGSSIDYIEIDGATNNGVESIRQLIENVQYLPTSGEYKVYVIDEVHMLSVSAFNALLKTLEEPPKHIIFIFATTDPQKLLGTVLSRCQRFDFKNLSEDELCEHIKIIAKAEDITFENERIVETLAKQGRGSVRDTLSLFDQVLSLSEGKTISEENAYMALGLANTKALKIIIESVLLGNSLKAQETYVQVLKENIDLKVFGTQLLDTLYDCIQQIDNGTHSGVVDKAILNELSISEIFWVYENLSKDLTWAISSINPTDVFAVVLKKIAMRREILGSKSIKIENIEKKSPEIETSDLDSAEVKAESNQVEAQTNDEITIQENSEEPQSEESFNEGLAQETKKETIEKESEETAEVLAKQEQPEKGPKNWEAFLKYLLVKNITLSENLKHGNTIAFNYSSEEMYLTYGFQDKDKILFDNLMQTDIFQALKKQMSEYFELEAEKIHLELKLVDAVDSADFKSKADIEIEHQQKQDEQKRENLLNNKYVKEAEKIFTSKVDKVILNKGN